MKKFFAKTVKGLVAALPTMTKFSVTVSANTVASPICGQPVPPASLKKYRKF